MLIPFELPRRCAAGFMLLSILSGVLSGCSTRAASSEGIDERLPYEFGGSRATAARSKDAIDSAPRTDEDEQSRLSAVRQQHPPTGTSSCLPASVLRDVVSLPLDLVYGAVYAVVIIPWYFTAVYIFDDPLF